MRATRTPDLFLAVSHNSLSDNFAFFAETFLLRFTSHLYQQSLLAFCDAKTAKTQVFIYWHTIINLAIIMPLLLLSNSFQSISLKQ